MGKQRIEVALTDGGDLAEVLRAVVDQSGLSRYAIAKQTGLSESTLSRMYTGTRPATLETLQAVCESLGRTLRVRVE